MDQDGTEEKMKIVQAKNVGRI